MNSTDASAGARPPRGGGRKRRAESRAPEIVRGVPSAESRVPVVPVICGPTAAGKSAIAMWLAQRAEICVISADSRQVYRGFDIGTGKPTASEQRHVPHRGVDVAAPTDRYSAAAWNAMARASIAEAHALRRTPVIVGGTGFYISTLFQPLWDEPEMDAATRTAVQSSLTDIATDELRRWCLALDPARAHLGRAQLIRAIEVALLTGERLSDLHRSRARPVAYTAHYLVVDPGPVLATQIAARVATMFEMGWVHEVRRSTHSVPEGAPAWNACGYRTVKRHVDGVLDRATAIEQVVIETRQFAKRQRTWFRNQLVDEHVTRVTPQTPGWEEVVERWFLQFKAESREPKAESPEPEAESRR